MFDHKYFRSLLMTGLACGSMICSSALAAPELEVVLYSGLSNSPPLFPGLYYNLGAGSFTSPVIDETGKIAVATTLFGDGITPANNRVMYYGDSNGWTIVARNGDNNVPGLLGLTLANLVNQTPAFAPNGKTLPAFTVSGGGITTANDTACFVFSPTDPPALLAQESTTIAPNTGGAIMTSSMNPTQGSARMNNAGQVLIGTNLSGGDVTAANNFGIYLCSPAGITEVARKGNPIPGAPSLPDPAGPFMTPDNFALFHNGAGEAASTGSLVAGTAGGVTTNDDKVVWTTVGGSMRLVARENDPVPGLNLVKYKAGSSFTMATMGLTNGGKLVYNATLDNIAPGTDVTTANDTCWLLDDHGTVSMVVREGDAIDGETFNFAQSSGGIFLTNDNRVVIAGAIVGAAPTGRLWTGPLGGPYTKIVQQGVTTLPGDPTITLDFSGSAWTGTVNNAGQIVFQSNLTGPGVVPGFNDRGVFGWSAETGLVLIGRNGTDLIPEILETSQLVLFGSSGFNGENGSCILTDNGWLVMRLQDVKGFQAIVRTKPFADEICMGDINGDDVVSVGDLLAVIAAWGATGSNPADVNGDSVVNVGDLLAVIGAWGVCN